MINTSRLIPCMRNNNVHTQVYASPQINFKFPQDLVRGLDFSSIMSEIKLSCLNALARFSSSDEQVPPRPIISLRLARSHPPPWVSRPSSRKVMYLCFEQFQFLHCVLSFLGPRQGSRRRRGGGRGRGPGQVRSHQLCSHD